MLARAYNYLWSFLPEYRRQDPAAPIKLLAQEMTDATYPSLMNFFQEHNAVAQESNWAYLIHRFHKKNAEWLSDKPEGMEWTPEQQLFIAAKTGDMAAVKDLIENKHVHACISLPNINFVPRGPLSVLSVALDNQQWDIACYLIEKGNGADINMHDARGDAPIHVILDYFRNKDIPKADEKALELVKFLVKYGADLSDRDFNGFSALHLAILANNCLVFDYCLEQGVDVNLDSATIEIAAAKKQGLTSYAYSNGGTPLAVAASWDRLEMAVELLRRGASVEGGPYSWSTPLMTVSSHYSEAAHAMLKLFAEHGADIHKHQFRNETPLHMAVEGGALKNVEYLLLSGASLEARNGQNKTPVDIFNDKKRSNVLWDGRSYPMQEMENLISTYQPDAISTPEIERRVSRNP